MKPGNLIELKNVSLRYRTYRSKRKSLRESIFRTITRRDQRVDVWALRDVSFEVRVGDALGVIGNNGAGKSTLCLLISSIMEPTEGTVEVAGTVSALLTLGAGFQNDLSGRENILINGVLLGRRIEEVESMSQSIIDFSGLGESIEQPVRTYSSGMRARLAFASATATEPEILIIDEVMGVGDLSFRQRSKDRMKELVRTSQALVVVSHNMETIRDLCTRVVWLENGLLVQVGPVDEVISAYEAMHAPVAPAAATNP